MTASFDPLLQKSRCASKSDLVLSVPLHDKLVKRPPCVFQWEAGRGPIRVAVWILLTPEPPLTVFS